MKLTNYAEKIIIKTLAILTVILMYLIFIFLKVVVPSIVIAYLMKINLVSAILIYISFTLFFLFVRRFFNRCNIVKEEYTPLEEIID